MEDEPIKLGASEDIGSKIIYLHPESLFSTYHKKNMNTQVGESNMMHMNITKLAERPRPRMNQTPSSE